MIEMLDALSELLLYIGQTLLDWVFGYRSKR